MKEYRLKINGEIDFIIISPQVLSSLISQIHNSLECEVAVNIEDIMPPGFTDYLLRVINTNRFTNKQFRYHYILENLVTKKGLYEILRQQLSNTDETRTIYRNSDGHPLVITPDGNGSWVDFDGNTYNFTSDEDAYDENGTSYYWHGEGADVYYMPVQ